METLSELLSERGIRLNNYGPGNHRTTCPNCSAARKKKNEPCLSVEIDDDGDGATWFCQHCNDFTDGVRVKPNGHGGSNGRAAYPKSPRPVKVPPQIQGEKSDGLYAFMEKRGISRATVDRLGVVATEAWFPQIEKRERCIAFPYVRNGAVVNHKYRSADKQFAQDKDALPTLYNIDAVAGAETVYWVEGEMDVLAMIEAGYPATVSLPVGAPAPRKDGSTPEPETMDKRFAALTNCADQLQHVKRFVLAGDMDGPGKLLIEETARRLGKELCWKVRWPDSNDAPCKDANQCLMEHGADVLRECIEAAEPWPISGIHEAREFEDGYWSFYRGEVDRGLSTGWPHLDDLAHVRAGDLWVVTGIPHHGKSEFIDALMVNAARLHDWRFGVASFENDPEHHMAKWAEKYLHAPFFDGPTPRMSESEAAAAFEWIKRRFFFITSDDESRTIDWILDKARALVLRHGVNMLVVDPWNEVEHLRPGRQTETEYISESLGKLRRFARSNDVLVALVAHPTKMQRDPAGKVPPPSLYDISGSAHFANKCDVGLTVFRDDDSPEGPVTEVHVRKVRHKWIGKKGSVRFTYRPATGEYQAIG